MIDDRSATDVAALLQLALDEPDRARTQAVAILEGSAGAWEASVARHALGIALREQGEGRLALAELRLALRLAQTSQDADRAADVRATLGLTLVSLGRTREGLSQLARAAEGARDPAVRAKVLMRRGLALSWLLGRHQEALGDLRRALEGFEASSDRMWEARTRNALGLLHQEVGEVDEAEEQLTAALHMFATVGDEQEEVLALHNLGIVAYLRGDLPRALATYDLVDQRYGSLGLDATPLALDRSVALLAAGLATEAAEVVSHQLARGPRLPSQHAELQLRLAAALLAAGDVRQARQQAREAVARLRRTGREWRAAQAQLVLLEASDLSGRRDPRQLGTARAVAEVLEAGGSDQAAAAWLLAGRLAARLDGGSATGLLARSASHRSDPPPLVRATGWLAHGLAHELAGDTRGVLLACRRGLDALDTHRETLGSSELRALATGHGQDLAHLALRHAVTGPPRRLLWWSERWRATSLARPPVRPGPQDETSAPLAALRDAARRLALARSEGGDDTGLRAEQARWEAEVRRRLRRTSGTRRTGTFELDVARLADALAGAALVELVEVDRLLHAVVLRDGRARTLVVGPVADAEHALDYARYVLRQAGRGRPAPVADAGTRLQRALLGEVAERLRGASAVVLSPTSRMHAAPWGLLPVLSGVPHSVVPSAALWLRACARRPASDRRVFVCGPGLTTGGSEVAAVAPRHPGATVLRDGTATVGATLAALDGAGLAHLAAHGHFREDSPLFSSLDLDDGPLTMHDLELLDRPPHRVVLSACESGVMAPVGAGELLGLVAALLSVGTAGVAASVVAVNDEATARLMVDVHSALDAGADLATALHDTRLAARGDPVGEATAASFLALGV